MKSLFSILLPTKNRPQYLCQALESIIKQDISNIEIIVSNNGKCKITAELVKKYSSDPRIKYFEPRKTLDMPTHWNTISSYATGLYTLILTDRSVLKKDSLKIIEKTINEFNNPLIVSWPWDLYNEELKLLIPHKFSNDKILKFSSKQKIKDFANGNYEGYPYFLPRGLNSAIKTEFINKLKKKYKYVYRKIAPDYTSSFICLLNSKNYIFINKSLFISQGFSVSNGSNCYKGSPREYYKDVDFKKFKHIPKSSLDLCTYGNKEDFFEMLELCDYAKFKNYWNKIFFYKECFSEISLKYLHNILKKEKIIYIENTVYKNLEKENAKIRKAVMSYRKKYFLIYVFKRIFIKFFPLIFQNFIKKYLYLIIFKCKIYPGALNAAGFKPYN